MIDYKKDKKRYIINSLGSLYIDENKLTNNERPIIYIGDQIEHRWHILEQTGKTLDPGHNMFTGSWMYDYPINIENKELIKASNFADNLASSLEEANLSDVDFITYGYGGNIAALLTKNERVHNVYAIHPPLLGTPLAKPKIFNHYKKILNFDDKLCVLILKMIVNYNYGFQKDKYNGIDLDDIDLNKLIVIGNSINPRKEKGYIKSLYNLIMLHTGFENDGVVIFDQSLFNNLGIQHEKEVNSLNYFKSLSKESLSNAKRLSKSYKYSTIRIK